MSEEELLQNDGGQFSVYRKGALGEIHFICHVDLMETPVPERKSKMTSKIRYRQKLAKAGCKG